jgi:hypothetical protein
MESGRERPGTKTRRAPGRTTDSGQASIALASLSIAARNCCRIANLQKSIMKPQRFGNFGGNSFCEPSHCKEADRFRCTRAFADNQDFRRVTFFATPYSQSLDFFLRPVDKGLLPFLRLVCRGYTHPRSVSFPRNSCRSLRFSEALQRVSPHFHPITPQTP